MYSGHLPSSCKPLASNPAGNHSDISDKAATSLPPLHLLKPHPRASGNAKGRGQGEGEAGGGRILKINTIEWRSSYSRGPTPAILLLAVEEREHSAGG